jgi:hypothetical protein
VSAVGRTSRHKIPVTRTEANVTYNTQASVVEKVDVTIDGDGSALEVRLRLGPQPEGEAVSISLDPYGDRADRADTCSLSLSRDQADTLGRMLIWTAALPDPTPAYYAVGDLSEELREAYELEVAYNAPG